MWSFKNGIPIYLQIISQFKDAILRGQSPPGQRIPSVRQLAVEAGVNPNTLMRALAALEQEGILIAERTSGKYVTSDQEKLQALRKERALLLISSCLSGLQSLGLDPSQCRTLFLDALENNDEKGITHDD